MDITNDTFNTTNMVTQRFAFPAPIIYYISKNPYLLIKLYQCSKYFYHKFRRDIIIKNFLILPDAQPYESFTSNSTKIRISNPALSNLKNFWITDSFIYYAQWMDGIIPKHFHCTVKKLELSDSFPWDEFQVLTKAGTVQNLKIHGIYMFGIEYASIENIIAQVPNATSIEIYNSSITPSTYTSLLLLKHKAKLTNFVVQNVDDKIFVFSTFSEFLRANAVPDCNVQVSFKLYPVTNARNIRDNEILELQGNLYNKTISLFLRKPYLYYIFTYGFMILIVAFIYFLLHFIF